jgi:hypothetical protein
MIKDRWIGLGADTLTPILSPSNDTNGTAAALSLTTLPVALPRCANASAQLQMWINAEVGVGGNLTVALIGGAATALPGFDHSDCIGIVGNRLAAPVRFRRAGAVGNRTGDLGPPARGTPQVLIDLRLQTPVRIFAWKFSCA